AAFHQIELHRHDLRLRRGGRGGARGRRGAEVRTPALLPVVLGLALTLMATPGAFADDPPPSAAPAAGAQAAAGEGPASEIINKIMQDNEAMLSGRGFTYDPAGRRDPFRSLVDAMNQVGRGPRPRGIAGMLISEVDLVGIVQKGKGTIAFFNGS